MKKFSEVYIAEKPSLARAIADGISKVQKKEKGYILVDGKIAVTNLFGHMLQLAPPGYYKPEWIKWDVATLPYNPEVFELILIEKAEDQMAVVGNLLENTDCVINAGDPDREGQMLVDEVIEYFKWTGKTLRLLPNAVDIVSIRKALASMRDNSEFINLYKSAMCRARADWIVGMSLSVAATKLLSGDSLISIGRVQTPTLGLVVRRDLEIEAFKSKDFFTLKASVLVSGNLLALEHAPGDDDRIYLETEAQALANEVKGKTYSLSVTEKDASEAPDLPFSLQMLQKEASSRFGLGAKDTLTAAQELYEKQLTSYPRTDCPYLPEEQKSTATSIAKKVMYAGFVKDAAPLESFFEPKGYIYDTKKAPVHHAIIPTGKPAEGLVGATLAVYELISRRFILSLLPVYKFKETRISFNQDERTFSAKGEVPLNLEKSWRAIEKKANPPVALPVIKDGAQGLVKDVEVNKGKTTPPKPYTEGDLLSDMSGVAKFVTDPNIKKILKESSGIGTPATQAAIIETLKQRGYVELAKSGKKDILKSTAYGREVIAAIPKQLKDPGLTATWEEALKSIAEGQYQDTEFMLKIVNFTKKRIDDMKDSTLKVTSKSPTQAKQAARAPFSPRPTTSSSHRSQTEPRSKAWPK